jgi:hypothetical protein
MKITSKDVPCPVCSARRGQPCKGSRIPSPSTLGGGWGGPVARKSAHSERVKSAKELAEHLSK